MYLCRYNVVSKTFQNILLGQFAFDDPAMVSSR